MQSSHQKNTKNSLFAAAPPHFRAAFGAPLAPVTLGPCHEDQSLGPCNYPTGIGSWQILNFLSKNPQLIFIYTHIHMHILVVYLFSCFSIYLSLFLSIFISFYLLVLMYVFNFLMLDLSIYSFLPSFLPSFLHSFIHNLSSLPVPQFYLNPKGPKVLNLSSLNLPKLWNKKT